MSAEPEVTDRQRARFDAAAPGARLRVDDALLFALPSAVVLQESMSLGPVNAGVLAFAVVIGFATFCRFVRLADVVASRAAMPLYAFVLGSMALELLHQDPSPSAVVRIGNMAIGALAVAAICRDRDALRRLLWGCAFAAAWTAALFVLRAGPIVLDSSASDFTEGTALRTEIVDAVGLKENLNVLAFVMAQGAAVALGLALGDPSDRRRSLRLVTAIAPVAGVLLTLSRGGVVEWVSAAVVVIVVAGTRWPRRAALAAIVAVAVALVLPAPFTARLTAADQYETGAVEARNVLFDALTEHVGDYWLGGVGAGHFDTSWGAEHGFTTRGDVRGAHNAYAQVTIFWGVAGLALLLGVIAMAVGSIRFAPDRATRLGVVALVVSTLVWLQLSHVLHAKQLSLVLGAAIAVRGWGRRTPRGEHRSPAPPVSAVRPA